MNTTAIVKLQVPMDKSLRDALAERAKVLGFDSTQAFIRFLAKAEVDGRKVVFGDEEWPEPSTQAAARINLEAKQALKDHQAGRLKTYNSADDLLQDLKA